MAAKGLFSLNAGKLITKARNRIRGTQHAPSLRPLVQEFQSRRSQWNPMRSKSMYTNQQKNQLFRYNQDRVNP